MSIWEFGLTERPLEAIKTRQKTVEARLYTNKFTQFKLDDTVYVRQDTLNSRGETVDGQAGVLRLKVTAVRRYPNFAALLEAEGYERVIPWVDSQAAALREFEAYYTPELQAAQGVVAIEVAVVPSAEGWNKLYQSRVEFGQLSDDEVLRVIQKLPREVSRTALDIGCGQGELVRQFQRAGLQAAGVDPSEVAIARARTEDPRGDYIVGDVADVRGVFGLVSCKHVYAFVADKEQFLSDVAQRLERGGIFLLTTPTHDRPVNHKKSIHVDRDTMLAQLRAVFQIIEVRQMNMGVVVICQLVKK